MPGQVKHQPDGYHTATPYLIIQGAQFYGDRTGVIEDPFGHLWTIATHTEDVSPEEIDRRLAAMKPKK